MARHEDLKRAVRSSARRFKGLENVVGVGRGYKRVQGVKTPQEAILILVREKVPLNTLSHRDLIPPDIDGIPTDVVEVGDIRFLGYTEYQRPAHPGVSIGHYKITAGTFGALVKDVRTGQPLILSNNHVLANSTDGIDGRAKVGDPILQPGPYDGGTLKDSLLGELDRYVPLQKGETPPKCEAAKAIERILNMLIRMAHRDYHVKLLKATSKANLVDAALARPLSREIVSPEILEIGQVRGVREAELGMTVKKCGRTTGLTRAEVEALDVSLEVGYGTGETLAFEDQILTSGMAKGGDSGSLVLTEDNFAVGLLFAGSDKSTVCNRIQNVMDLLGVRF